MYVFEFLKNKHINIDYNARFSLFDSLEMLRKWNTEAVSKNVQFVISYKLFNEVNNEVVLVDQTSIGTNYTIDFFQTTRDRLKGLYANEELTEILKLIETIEAQYHSEKDDYYSTKSIEIRDEILETPAHSNEDDFKKKKTPVKSKKKKIQKNSSKTDKETNKKAQSELIASFNKLPHSIKYGSIAVLIVFVIGIIFLVSSFLLESENQLETYDQLIESEQYLEALKQYPQRYAEVEQSIFDLGDTGISYLEEFTKEKNDYIQAELDLAYLKKDYAKVTELGLSADTDRRKSQVIIAYIHQGDFKNATELNRVVHDEKLNQLIDEAYYYLIIDSLNKGDLDTVTAYQGYANNPEINQIVETIQLFDNQIAAIGALPEKEQTGFINGNKLKHLKEQRLELLNKNIFSKQSQTSPLNIILATILSVIAFIFIGHFSITWFENKKPNANISGFNELLNNELYIEALKLYPQKYPEIERHIFQLGERAMPHLEEFISKKKGYKQAQFDLSFLKKEYDKVIKLGKFADTDGRKAQLVTAYIQSGEIDRANEINQYIKVPEFSRYLSEHYYQLSVEALKNDDFSMAKHYQELNNSTDIEYLIDTIRLIDEKIQTIEVKLISDNNDNSDNQSKLKKLIEMRLFSLELA